MLDYRRKLFFGVTRVETTFADDLNPPRVGFGTGFWIRLSSGKDCFVTNRHNLDPSLKFPGNTKLRCETMRIELRRNLGTETEPQFVAETRFFELDDQASKIFITSNADCALVFPQFKSMTEGFAICAPFDETDLASEDFFTSALMPAHELYFIGYAGNAGDSAIGRKAGSWWDTKWNLPVVRSAAIASMPFLNFHNEAIQTEDVMLVNGMSFSGSSGSPVVSRQIGYRVQPPLSCEHYAPEKVIGIMSGHWWADKDYPDVFKHSGLSYLTRSTSILHLIRTHAA